MTNLNMLGKRTHEGATCKVGYTTALPVEMRVTIREVHSLHTEPGMRGKGMATKLLKQVCEEADKCGKVMILLPDDEKLAAWYQKFGFELIQQEPKMIMARKVTPQG